MRVGSGLQKYQVWIKYLQNVYVCLTVILNISQIDRTRALLLWGKIRRGLLCMVPAIARYLQRKYQLRGRCRSCGSSCNLLFQCPQWDPVSRLCKIYEQRPLVCKLFPITPSDLQDLATQNGNRDCGYGFK